MAPNRENLIGSSSTSSSSREEENKITHKNHLPRLCMESLQRTISDISLELITKQALDHQDEEHDNQEQKHDNQDLPAIVEVDEVKCECCGMSEECTSDYVNRVRSKFSGKLICGLCAEAVDEEMEKKKAKRDEALKEHMSACSRFNKLGRAYPVLFQADAIREILKKSSNTGISARGKSVSPRDYKSTNIGQRKLGSTGGLARSSSCIPAIRKELD
ncbi:hypothetical protein L484_010723 [Morus notabilis]|uniref:DUF1677 domain-containing protein n=1 Tax=Morus notabilis TaxID=981085 RepID=W9RIG3_9ROSA|nr:uncharacterized protein LOC21394011 [Morus notabilis]EXB93395.1 hypothetical protein L484_010723 [Morus notabilis]